MKKLTLLSFTFIFLSMNVNAQIPFEDRQWAKYPELFDKVFYIQKHKDVANSGLTAVNHWINYGVKEGRQGSPVFDAKFYLQKHPDLLATFGSKGYKKAMWHFYNTGRYEGRQGSAEFNPKFYRNKYKDLSDKFGDDMVKYYTHYLDYGRMEGRKGVQ